MVGKEILRKESSGEDINSFIHLTFTEHFLCMQ